MTQNADEPELPQGWPHRDVSRLVDAAGYRFHVQQFKARHSARSTSACLLLHGTGASSHSWAGLVPLLMEHTDVIAIDLPGHGFTQTPGHADLSLPGVARAVACLMNELDIETRIGIGHSAGAAILAELSLSGMLQIDRLISLNGALLPLEGVAGMVFSPLARLGAGIGWLPGLFARRASDRQHVLRLINSTGSRIDDAGLQCYQALFCRQAHVSGVLKLMANWQLEALKPRLPRLEVPVQLIAADADRTIPLREAYRLHALLPDSRLSVLEGLGHLAHEEAPARVLEQIRPGLSSCSETQGQSRTAMSQHHRKRA